MRRWYVVHRAGRFVSPATAAFVEFVVEAAPGLLAEMHSAPAFGEGGTRGASPDSAPFLIRLAPGTPAGGCGAASPTGSSPNIRL